MTARILVIGGYGNFGTYIVRRLAGEPGVVVIVGGRSADKARQMAEPLKAEWIAFDIGHRLDDVLVAAKPDIVIHTSGPYQDQGYAVASACIRRHVHYIDIADGRAFVANIVSLDESAKAAGVSVISGASSVPALTSAIVERYRSDFQELLSLDYGIATAQKSNHGGLATTRAILGYAGKPFETLVDGRMTPIYGWQSLTWRKFANLGWRALGNCDVPDLALFPALYPELRTIRFRAGIELPFIHLSLWALTWLVRIGLIRNLKSAARPLLALSRPFDFLGTANSGFFMEMIGLAAGGQPRRLVFELAARSGDGAMIPCMPAIVAALKLARGEIKCRGAQPCVGLLSLDDILRELGKLDISWAVSSG